MVGYRPILNQEMLESMIGWFTFPQLDMVVLALPLLYTVALALMWLEHKYPAKKIAKEKSWYVRALLVNALVLMVFFAVDYLWEHYAGAYSLFHFSDQLSPFLGAMLGYFIFTFVVYWWHRLRHASSFVWRLFHQLHHSPKRIETLTAYYIHPLDMLANLLISNTIVYILLGLNIEAAAWYTFITGTAGFLIHANINMPRKAGYVFQTPKMHRLHHKSGHHAQNYSDIVWWDMLFGTYANPKEEIAQCGFSNKNEKRLWDMLRGKELHISNKVIHNDSYRFLDFSSYEMFMQDEIIVKSFVSLYKEIFKDPELWAEEYSTQEIHERLKEELAGTAQLRLCVSEDEVVAFAWVQELSIKDVKCAIESIEYYERLGSPDISSVLQCEEEKVMYLHDLGVKKDKRGEVSLRMLLCPMIQTISQKSEAKEVFFWTIEKTKISILARYIGFKKVATVESMQFFKGSMKDSKVGMICDKRK